MSSDKMSKLDQFLRPLRFVLALGALIAMLYGIPVYIDGRVEQRLRDPAFLREMAKYVRPAIVFNEHGAILVDQGGMAVVDSITVELDPVSGLPAEIVVVPREFLALEPLLQILDDEGALIEAERGEGFRWVFRLTYFMWNSAYDGHRRFFLQIFR